MGVAPRVACRSQPIPEVPVVELSVKNDAAVLCKLAEAAAQPFDLTKGPLCRVRRGATYTRCGIMCLDTYPHGTEAFSVTMHSCCC